jgi:hypothetical protein
MFKKDILKVQKHGDKSWARSVKAKLKKEKNFKLA